jgi:hypothetical protein
MRSRNRNFAILLAATALSAHVAAQSATYKAPRTGDGHPDLQGVWNFSSDVPLERPPAFADKKFFTREELEAQKAGRTRALETVAKFVPVEAIGLDWLDHAAQLENLRTSLVMYPENGRVPALVEGVRRVPGVEDFIAALSQPGGGPPPALLTMFGAGKKDGIEDFSSSERCLADGNTGPPLMPGFDYNYVQIIQAKEQVVLLTEALHHARIVPLDGKRHVGETLRGWSGDSRGRWDGETLVIETTNFNRRTRSFAGAGNSYNKVVTERFTRISRNVLEYEATVVDPKTFQDKVVMTLPMAKVDGGRIFETACHEGNYSVPNTLSAARKLELDR